MKGKKNSKSPGKKQNEKKGCENSLIALLKSKHVKVKEGRDLKSQTAYLLETILSGTDEQLGKVLEEWSNFSAIEGVVRGWGPKNSILLFQRLTLLMEGEYARWTYPWINAILNTQIGLNSEDLDSLRQKVGKGKEEELQETIRFEGKLRIFAN